MGRLLIAQHEASLMHERVTVVYLASLIGLQPGGCILLPIGGYLCILQSHKAPGPLH